jgi:hypothetical protein
MSLPSESTRSRRPSLAWAMALVAVAAADLAALRAALPITLPIDPGANPSLPPTFWREHLPTLPDLGFVVMVLVLEPGLFRLFSRRGPERAFWLGFEVAGWAYVITCLTFAPVTWRLVYSLFEGDVLGRPMSSTSDMERFILFAGGLHLLISLALAYLVGVLARRAWRLWQR